MLKSGILNPKINALLSRFRHTNTIVIADRGFPFWPEVPTIDIALINDLPKVLEVLKAIRKESVIGKAWMAQEFLENNASVVVDAFGEALKGIELAHAEHEDFKLRVPKAIGLIRTGETIQYANIILESA